ncbi:PREDICTED: ran-binding protein 1 homolog a-like [Brassica oleracea var. oleracea]|uniref:ran-binding protein 1 homolog a-like n=1 Tax=Brassica oleracea var. oleracea TaxID=109376 RepID=UPI0006A6EDF5|nr:PREDICTED: ran-binding protein 1 homolog a-like [Brassica oleracea var. oleracea]
MTHSSRDWPVSVWKVFSYSISFFPFPVMKDSKVLESLMFMTIDCKAFMEKFKEVAESEEEKEETKEASDTAGLLEKLTVEEKNTEEEKKEEKPVEKVASADARRESC